MTRLRLLDATRHGALRLDRARGGARRRLVPLGRGEIAFAAADMPLCFAKDAQTGRFELVALLALAGEDNLFTSPAGYHATYQPRAAGLGALRLDPAGADGLAVDEADASLGGAGDALFTDGSAARWQAELRAVVDDVVAGRALGEVYAHRGLLRPLRITLTMVEGDGQVLDGLYVVADAALAELPDADVVAMHRADELAPAAILTASLAQVERLRQLHNARYPRQIATIGLAVAD